MLIAEAVMDRYDRELGQHQEKERATAEARRKAQEIADQFRQGA